MGKRRYKQADVSKSMTKTLAIEDLLVLKTSTTEHYETIHRRYFSDEKLECPTCGQKKTRCSKVVKRRFKDILWDDTATEDDEERDFLVVDLVFYQRYMRCDECGGNVFPEPIGFGDKGCRYTNRLSDALADGTFRFSYKKVCEYYGVPASTASIGPIMRRRIRYRESQLLPVYTPKKLGIMEVTFFRRKYPVVFALREDGVYCMDILENDYEETVLTFLRTLNTNKVESVYIDPVDTIRNAAATAFPSAKLIVSDECILRYAKNAMLDIIHEDGKRFPIKFKDAVLTIPNNRLQNDYERNQVAAGMENRPRLKKAYDKHQSLMDLLSGEWTYEALSQWSEELLDEMPEFLSLIDGIEMFYSEINAFISEDSKLPEFYQTALQAVCDAFRGMPHCIFDVLRARCFLTISYDSIEEDGAKYRLGILTTRLTTNMNEISENIKEAREYGL